MYVGRKAADHGQAPHALSSEDAEGHDVRRLRELVKDHEVCWEIRPEYVSIAGSLRSVGFVVDVSATHRDPRQPPVAGCDECQAPLEVLEEVIAFVLPREHRDSIYDVRVMWGSLRYNHRRGNRPEVAARILIEHAEGADKPIDACERRCLDDIVSKLKTLGAREGA